MFSTYFFKVFVSQRGHCLPQFFAQTEQMKPRWSQNPAPGHDASLSSPHNLHFCFDIKNDPPFRNNYLEGCHSVGRASPRILSLWTLNKRERAYYGTLPLLILRPILAPAIKESCNAPCSEKNNQEGRKNFDNSHQRHKFRESHSFYIPLSI